MKPLFYKFGKNIGQLFKGYNILWQLLAIPLTYYIVHSGFDWNYFLFFNGSLLASLLFSAAIVGALVPIIIPLGILLYGKIKNNVRILNTGFALGQAALIGFLLSSFYKIFSGRVGPPLGQLSNSILDTSRTFYFGFLRGGIFWGWPSSHTTIAFAMAFTLVTLYPKNKLVKTLSLVYALYIGIGVSMTIHWFSDFAAGIIFGVLIGVTVGKAFRARGEAIN
jgi:membrane-associated phospholipid phosphatase